MLTYFIDTETCGFHGVPVLLQYAINDGPVQIHHLWTEPINKTLSIIEDIVDNRVVAHNLRFDWFHLSKLYNMLKPISHKNRPLKDFPLEYLADLEYEARNGLCLKPRAAVCTYILAQKSEDQSMLMDAKPVYIRRVPTFIADELRTELEARTDLPWILFAGRQTDERWFVADRKNDLGEIDPLWKDLKLSFAPSKSLKDLSNFLLGHKPSARYDEIAFEEQPIEAGYAPFALLLSNHERGWMAPDKEGNLKPTWPAIIHKHIRHWSDDEAALAYAQDDILMLRKLYSHFESPDYDQDGMLACQVASVRLRGFKLNLDRLEEEYKKSDEIVRSAQLNVNSPEQCRGFIAEALDEMEQLIVAKSCDKKILKKIKSEFTLDEKEECYCNDGCVRCGGKGEVGPGPMPVVKRAEHIEQIRQHIKRREIYTKLRLAQRFFPDFNVIGAKSGRMSGTSGLNAQGIKKSEDMRSIFELADEGFVLSGGDYSSQELAIAATTMNDDDLMRDMESGKSLHGLFGAELFETTYEDIMANKDEPNSRYDRAKSAVYLTLYGGTFETMARNCGVDAEVARRAYNNMVQKYPQMGSTRQAITDRFSSLTQPGGSGSPIVFRDPPEKFIESIFGFRRYFHCEYEIQKMILDLAQNMPEGWREIRGTLSRKEGRVQTVAGAISSALYGAAFSIQNKVIRASNNHIIQSTGREITMGMQHAVWSLQPQGINEFEVACMSVHDEIAAVTKPEKVAELSEVVEKKVDEQCEMVPLIAIEWGRELNSWAHLKSAKAKYGDDVVSYGWSPEGAVA